MKLEQAKKSQIPLDTRCRFNVYKTSTVHAKTVNKADYRKNDTILLSKSTSEYLLLNFRAGLEHEEMEKGVTFQNCLYDIFKIFR